MTGPRGQAAGFRGVGDGYLKLLSVGQLKYKKAESPWLEGP